jgi:Spy/CpxP family protein refolding chaperone
MRTFVAVAVSLAAVALGVFTAMAQPPQGEIRTRQGPPQGPYGPPPDGRQPLGGPPRWELGKLIPPPIQDELNLTDEQQKQLHDLEKEVRDRVMKMLTSEQKDKLKRLQNRGLGGPPDGRGEPPDRRGPPRGEGRPDRGGPPRGEGQRGGPPDRDGPPDRPGRREPPDRPEPPDDQQSLNHVKSGAIQWFATWESGIREARRSGRPILLVSAAPHCAGVPGVW